MKLGSGRAMDHQGFFFPAQQNFMVTLCSGKQKICLMFKCMEAAIYVFFIISMIPFKKVNSIPQFPRCTQTH